MNKKKMIIIGTLGIIALTSAIVIPIVVINSNNDKKNKEDVVAIIKILKEKSISERTLKLASDSNDKIIANNKEKVIKKVKELIGTSKLREVLIDVTMTTDANVSTVEQAIIVTIKKGEHSQKLEGKNGLKVKRALTTIEQTDADIKSAKIALENLSQKTTIVDIRGAANQKITTNKAVILRAIKDISGYSDLVLKGVAVTIKDSNTLIPINSSNAVGVTLILIKIGGTQVEITGFTVKQMSVTQHANLDIKFVKSILDAKSSKLVQIKDSAKKVGALGVATKIKNALETQVGSTNLKNVVITVSANTTNATMNFLENGIGFIITLSKSNGTSISITDWKVRLKTNAEIKQENQVLVDDFYNYAYKNWSRNSLYIHKGKIGSETQYTATQLIEGIKYEMMNFFPIAFRYSKTYPLFKLKQIGTQKLPAANGFYSVNYYTSDRKVILEIYWGSSDNKVKKDLTIYIKRGYLGIRTKK